MRCRRSQATLDDVSSWPLRAAVAVFVASSSACDAQPAPPSPSEPPTVDVGGPFSRAPAAVDERTAHSIERLCREAFSVAPDLPVRHPDQVEGARLAVVDARGQGIWHAIFGEHDAGPGGLCWNGEVLRNGLVRRAARADLLLTWPELPAPGGSAVCSLALIAHPHDDQQAFTLAGRAGDDVTSVVVDVRGVGEVIPTFEDGSFLAWWPGTSRDFTVIGLDAAGGVVVEMDFDDGGGCSDA
jgi:hypothetical protein